MYIVGIDAFAHLSGRNATAVACQQFYGSACIEGNATAFVLVDMSRFIADDLIAGLCMAFDGDLVGHGARRTKQGRLHFKEGSALLLKGINGRIFAKHIIAKRGFHHGLMHAGSGAGDGIGPVID